MAQHHKTHFVFIITSQDQWRGGWWAASCKTWNNRNAWTRRKQFVGRFTGAPGERKKEVTLDLGRTRQRVTPSALGGTTGTKRTDVRRVPVWNLVTAHFCRTPDLQFGASHLRWVVSTEFVSQRESPRHNVDKTEDLRQRWKGNRWLYSGHDGKSPGQHLAQEGVNYNQWYYNETYWRRLEGELLELEADLFRTRRQEGVVGTKLLGTRQVDLTCFGKSRTRRQEGELLELGKPTCLGQGDKRASWWNSASRLA